MQQPSESSAQKGHAAKRGIPIHHTVVNITSHLLKRKQICASPPFSPVRGHLAHYLHFSPCRQMKTDADSQLHTPLSLATLPLTFPDLLSAKTFFVYLLGMSLKFKLHSLFHPKMPQDSARSTKHHATPGNGSLLFRSKRRHGGHHVDI